ncbi:hypothetical protein GA0115239_109417 [Streptomyces sp. BpilaLS-43]|nr:hypothetical protein GA0115239_109417 [Streptomyces sp. BpilaLS-43]
MGQDQLALGPEVRVEGALGHRRPLRDLLHAGRVDPVDRTPATAARMRSRPPLPPGPDQTIRADAAARRGFLARPRPKDDRGGPTAARMQQAKNRDEMLRTIARICTSLLHQMMSRASWSRPRMTAGHSSRPDTPRGSRSRHRRADGPKVRHHPAHRLSGVAEKIEKIVAKLPRMRDVSKVAGMAERRLAEGDATFVADLGIALHGKYGAEGDSLWQYRSLFSTLLRLLTVTPGQENIEQGLRLVATTESGRRSQSRHVASLLASSHPPHDLVLVFDGGARMRAPPRNCGRVLCTSWSSEAWTLPRCPGSRVGRPRRTGVTTRWGGCRCRCLCSRRNPDCPATMLAGAVGRYRTGGLTTVRRRHRTGPQKSRRQPRRQRSLRPEPSPRRCRTGPKSPTDG